MLLTTAQSVRDDVASIYFLSEYNWLKGELVSSGPKNNKILIPAQHGCIEHTKAIPKEKCASGDEEVCVVWEMWKGRNGRGGYRVERNLYLTDRVSASRVHYQDDGQQNNGRVTEIAPGVKR